MEINMQEMYCWAQMVKQLHSWLNTTDKDQQEDQLKYQIRYYLDDYDSSCKT